MPALSATLERIVPDHFDTDAWEGNVRSQGTTSLNNLRAFRASPDVDLLFGPPWLSQGSRGKSGRPKSADQMLGIAVYPPGSRQYTIMLPIRLAEQHWSRAAATLVWEDLSGGVKVSLSQKLARKTADLTIDWHQRDDVSPTALLRLLKFRDALKAPNRVGLHDSTGKVLTISSLPQRANEQNDLREYMHVIELLERVERLSKSSFPVPSVLDQDDINGLARADHLLRGDVVTGTWKEASIILTPTASGGLIVEDEGREAPMIYAVEETLLVAGNPVNLGVIGHHFLSTRIKSWSRIDHSNRGRLTIVPGETNELETWRIADESTSIEQVIPGVSWKFRHQVSDFMDQNDELLRRLAQ